MPDGSRRKSQLRLCISGKRDGLCNNNRWLDPRISQIYTNVELQFSRSQICPAQGGWSVVGGRVETQPTLPAYGGRNEFRPERKTSHRLHEYPPGLPYSIANKQQFDRAVIDRPPSFGSEGSLHGFLPNRGLKNCDLLKLVRFVKFVDKNLLPVQVLRCSTVN
jgi:hypothetical protein